MTNQQFKQLRQSTGLSVKEITALFNTPYITWYQWEEGIRRLPGIAVVCLKTFKLSSLTAQQIRYYADKDIITDLDNENEDIPFV